MREELALNHLLLRQAMEMARAATRHGDEQTRAALDAVGDHLRVTWRRNEQLFVIESALNNQPLSISAGKQDFRFHQMFRPNTGDVAGADNNQAEAPDTIASANQIRARQVLTDMLAQAGVALPARLAIDAEKAGAETKSLSGFAPLFCVLLIALCSAALTWYQGTRTFNLIDNTYTLETAWRIANGEVPYRDFRLVVMPGVYLKQALLIKLFGPVAITGLWWCLLAMPLTILLTWTILRLLDTPRWLAVALCLIPAAGGNVVRPYVWYDVDALLFCLGSMALLLWSEKHAGMKRHLFLIGLLSAVPLIFKQNIGVAHLTLVTLLVRTRLAVFPYAFPLREMARFMAGALAGLCLLFAPFLLLGALRQLFYDTIILAGALRVDKPLIPFLFNFFPLAPLMRSGDWPELDTYLAYYLSSFLLWGAMAISAVSWFAGTHNNLIRLLLPFWVAAVSLASLTALGEFSVFPLMPLIAILLAQLHAFLTRFPRGRWIATALTCGLAIALSASLCVHALSGHQLFFYRNAFSNPMPFHSAGLRGLSASADIAGRLDALVEFVNTLPAQESIALTPTEDPIYFLTGRQSPLYLLQRFKQTGGDANWEYLPEMQRVRPAWVIEKRDPQFRSWVPRTVRERHWLFMEYCLVREFSGYLIWKRNDLPMP
ncbi:MAG: hypothetical protein ACKV2V_12310 [Blastocatellia bacterium]